MPTQAKHDGLRSNPPFWAGCGIVFGRFDAQNRRCLDLARCKNHRISTPITLNPPVRLDYKNPRPFGAAPFYGSPTGLWLVLSCQVSDIPGPNPPADWVSVVDVSNGAAGREHFATTPGPRVGDFLPGSTVAATNYVFVFAKARLQSSMI